MYVSIIKEFHSLLMKVYELQVRLRSSFTKGTKSLLWPSLNAPCLL